MLTNQIKLDNFTIITYCSVEILPIIFGHFKYNYVWIWDVVDLPEQKKEKTDWHGTRNKVKAQLGKKYRENR